MAQFENPGIRNSCHRAGLPRLYGVRGYVQRGSALLHAADRRAPAPPPPAPRCSASTMTNTSTRPRTCNTSPGRTGRGLVSTGAMTAAWWPGRSVRRRQTCANGRRRQPALSLTFPESHPDQQFQAGLFCGSACTPRPTTPDQSHNLCPASHYGSTLVNDSGAGNRRTTTTIRRESPAKSVRSCVGHDNLFHGDRYKWSVAVYGDQPGEQVSAVQLSLDFQRHALRDAATLTAEIGFHF